MENRSPSVRRPFFSVLAAAALAAGCVSAAAPLDGSARIRENAAERVAAMPSAADAAFALASPFSDHMVLQRECTVPVWGTGAPGERVEVRLFADGEEGKTVAEATATVGANGRWIAFLPPQPAGGPFSLDAKSGGGALAVENILIGDVWLCGGQSNMEMDVRWTLPEAEIPAACEGLENVRLINVPNAVATAPCDSFRAKWQVCSPESARRFSGVGFFFGRKIHRELGVPVGLVQVDYTGSVAETWLSLDGAAAIPGLETAVDVRRRVIAEGEEAGRARFREIHEAWEKAVDPIGDAAAAEDFAEGDGWTDVSTPFAFAKDYDGIVWIRRAFDLDAARAAADAELFLGWIDDADDSFVNGVPVGTSRDPRKIRQSQSRYKLPAGLLREGRNVLAIRLLDKGGGGGFVGRDKDVPRLEFGDAAPALSLAGAGWRRFDGPSFAERREPKEPSFKNQFVVSACYNAMVFPLFPLAVRGAIWYQGCANVGRHRQYETLLPAVVGEWRAGFASAAPDGAFPFYLVQLASVYQTSPMPGNSDWAAMRWTQTKLGRTLPNSGTVVTLDVGDRQIHPHDKRTPGERLADLALAQTYGRPEGRELSPVPAERAALRDGAVEVAFVRQIEGTPPVVLAADQEVRGFELAGENGRFVRVGARTGDAPDVVRVQVPERMVPVRVRYAWDHYPDCNLKTAAGLPVGSFELPVAPE